MPLPKPKRPRAKGGPPDSRPALPRGPRAARAGAPGRLLGVRERRGEGRGPALGPDLVLSAFGTFGFRLTKSSRRRSRLENFIEPLVGLLPDSQSQLRLGQNLQLDRGHDL